LFFQNILDYGEREEMAVLKFFDETDAFYIVVIIFRNVPSPLEGLRKESLSDVKMDGLLGYSGMLNEISDLQESPCPACRGLKAGAFL
jgi:hypothetical protein